MTRIVDWLMSTPGAVTFSTNGRNFPSVEFFSYLIDVLNHFLCLLRRTSRDRNVYCIPLNNSLFFYWVCYSNCHILDIGLTKHKMSKYLNTKK